MAVAKKSKSQKSAGKTNKANGKPNGKPDATAHSAQLASKARAGVTAGVAAAAPRDNEAQIAVHWKEEEYFYPSP